MNIENSFEIENEVFYFYDLEKVFVSYENLRKLPICLKIALEQNLRNIKDNEEYEKIISAFLNKNSSQINIYPSRIVMQDFRGIPNLVDLVSMRDKLDDLGINSNILNPKIMFDLVIDNRFTSHKKNYLFLDDENNFEQYKDIYKFIKWSKKNLKNFRVVPPGSGICHKVNLEYLSTIININQKNSKNYLYPETLIGTNTNKTMINSFGIFAWRVSDIEALSSIFGIPILVDFPKVIGFEIKGELSLGITAYDTILALIDKLQAHNLDGKIIEFYGDGLKSVSLEDRVVISNIVSKYKAISSYFPIDDKTILYYDKTRDSEDFSKLIKTYLEKQSLYFKNEKLDYDEIIQLDLNSIETNIFVLNKAKDRVNINILQDFSIKNRGFLLKDGDIVLALIKSSLLELNPYSLIHSALLAKKIFDLGFSTSSHINKILEIDFSLTKRYLEELDLLKYFELLGFEIKNSENKNIYTLDKILEEEIKSSNLNVFAISSEALDLEEKIHPLIKSNYLMSPSLIMAYIVAKQINIDILNTKIDSINDKEITLVDIWPKESLVVEYLNKLDSSFYKKIYENIYKGNDFWQSLEVEKSDKYLWSKNSTYIQPSNFFKNSNLEKINIENANILAIFGDDINIDDISPLGKIIPYSAAALYLESKGLHPDEFNTYESRKGNSEVMIRSIFSSNGIKNKIVKPKEGAFTKDFQSGEIMSIYDFVQKTKEQKRKLVIFAGNNYGDGISRNWAAKATKLIGVKAIIAKSFKNTHRINLLSMGVLPLQFLDDDIESLNLRGDELITIKTSDIKLKDKIELEIRRGSDLITILVQSLIQTEKELLYYKNGGVLAFVLKNLIENNSSYEAK